jgi:hypothetical protein
MASTMMAAHTILRGLSTSGRMASTSKATPILNRRTALTDEHLPAVVLATSAESTGWVRRGRRRSAVCLLQSQQSRRNTCMTQCGACGDGRAGIFYLGIWHISHQTSRPIAGLQNDHVPTGGVQECTKRVQKAKYLRPNIVNRVACPACPCGVCVPVKSRCWSVACAQ